MKKKIVLLLLAAFLLTGCGTAVKESEFWDHPSWYSTWDHLSYSWSGYKKADSMSFEKAQSQGGWWGIETGGM